MPKSNGFCNFMFSLKKQLGQEISINELQLIAGEKWKNLSEEERATYKGNKTEPVTQKKYNCVGTLVESQSRLLNQKRINDEKITMYIEQMIQKAIEKETNGLFSQVFYFFSASYFARKRNEDIFPAEIALAKFSLKAGIIDKMHMMINPGELPLGYPGEALFHAKRTHRLDLPPNIPGEKSYKKILDAIIEFVGAERFTSEHIPPFFTYEEMEDDDFLAAEMTLDKIATENDQYNAFRVYKADTLFFILHKHVIENRNFFYGSNDKSFASVVTAWDMLRRDDFRYSLIGCDKHNDDDNSTNCCLSKVQRLCFSFVQYCLDDRFKKVIGAHYPTTYDQFEITDEDAEWEQESKYSNSSLRLTESFRALSVHHCSSKLSRTHSNFTYTTQSLDNTVSASTMNSLKTIPSFQRMRKFKVQLPENVKESKLSVLSSENDLKSNSSFRRRICKFNSNISFTKPSNNGVFEEEEEEENSTMDRTSLGDRTPWIDRLANAPTDI